MVLGNQMYKALYLDEVSKYTNFFKNLKIRYVFQPRKPALTKEVLKKDKIKIKAKLP